MRRGHARILSLPPELALFAAAAGGLAGALVGVAFDHTAGLVVGVGVFAASCAGYEDARTAHDAIAPAGIEPAFPG